MKTGMTYKLVITRRAEKDLAGIPKKVAARIHNVLVQRNLDTDRFK
jgi:mRNA-degrading endonuclease RelE of RelBE toxin-antitoxin system